MAVVECRKEGRIAHIVINRPDAMNALNAEVFRGLRDAMEDFRDNDSLWVAILPPGREIKPSPPERILKVLVSGFSAKGDFTAVRPVPSGSPLSPLLTVIVWAAAANWH